MVSGIHANMEITHFPANSPEPFGEANAKKNTHVEALAKTCQPTRANLGSWERKKYVMRKCNGWCGMMKQSRIEFRENYWILKKVVRGRGATYERFLDNRVKIKQIFESEKIRGHYQPQENIYWEDLLRPKMGVVFQIDNNRITTTKVKQIWSSFTKLEGDS